MDVKNLIMAIIGLSLGAVMIGAALLPVVASASDDQYTVFNNSNGQYSSIVGDSLEISYVFDSENKTYEYIANGENVALRVGQDVVFITDTCLFKMGVVNNPSNYIVYYDGSSHIIQNLKSLTVSASGGTCSLNWVTSSNANGSVELEYSWGFYATAVGDHRAIFGNDTIYYHDIGDIYGSYWHSSGIAFVTFNGENATYNGNPATVEYNSSSVSGVVDVYSTTLNEFSETGIVVSYDNVNSGAIIAIVPDKVVGDKTGYSDVISTLFNVVPIVAIAGVVLAGVYIFISRK